MTICAKAFSQSDIERFIWPAKCKAIPSQCFFEAKKLKTLDLSNLTELDIKAGCLIGVNRDAVIFPYYTSPDTMEEAFNHQK